jgi:poly(3-hydroxybutyrate) depolymerase
MLYPWTDWQRISLFAWLDAARVATAATPLEPLLGPPRELLARTLAAGAAVERPLETAVRRDASFPVLCETVAESPFVRLVRVRRPGARRQRALVLAPHSGYSTAVISPLVAALAVSGEVVATDWVDARLVPRDEGGFGLEGQIAAGLEAAAALGAPAHLVALSQSGPAALAVAALLAARTPELTPVSLAFLGCQLDPAARHTPLQRVLARWPRQLLAASLTALVGAGYPGAGRRVYPSLLQLLAYGFASPRLYAEAQQGLLRELAAGQAGGGYGRQHHDLHSLLDVPAELFLETLDWLLGEAPWDGDRPIVGGRPHDLAALRRLPLLTVESGRDELVGRGQTHALRRRMRAERARAATLRDGRHHDLFTGPGFLAGMAPVLRRFHAEHAA